MNYCQNDLPERLADEFVLGSMQGLARRRFEKLEQQFTAFQQARLAAEKRWNPLAQALTPVPPSRQLWQQIERRINHQNTTSAAVKTPGLHWWRGWAMAMSLALLVVLIAPLDQLNQSPPGIVQQVVVITHIDDDKAGWLVSLKPETQQIKVVSLSSHQLPAEKVYELWVKAPENPQVESVGLIAAQGTSQLSTTKQLYQALINAELLGVSVEPLGGSPTGQPTSAPQFFGKPHGI